MYWLGGFLLPTHNIQLATLSSIELALDTCIWHSNSHQYLYYEICELQDLLPSHYKIAFFKTVCMNGAPWPTMPFVSYKDKACIQGIQFYSFCNCTCSACILVSAHVCHGWSNWQALTHVLHFYSVALCKEAHAPMEATGYIAVKQILLSTYNYACNEI